MTINPENQGLFNRELPLSLRWEMETSQTTLSKRQGKEEMCSGIQHVGFCLFVCFCFIETVFLCVTALAVLELALLDHWSQTYRDPPASASQVLGLKVYSTTARLSSSFLKISQDQVWKGFQYSGL